MTQTYKLSGSVNYTRRDYWRDTRDRITAWKKTETGRGDRYGYDAEGQLTSGLYNCVNPEGNPAPDSQTRTDTFYYDALGNRMGSNWIASRGQMWMQRRDNGLNQYRWWNTPAGWWSYICHDDNLGTSIENPTPVAPWVPPANGVTMADGLITASYNALNQPVAVYSPALPVGQYMWFGFDPLGRCVKRWLASSSNGAGSNPATYFYYDGWNLIQEGVNANTPGRIYVHGARVDEIVASCIWSGNQWAYHHYDARGHAILLTLPNGNIQEKYEYDAFGQPYFYNASGVAQPKVNNRPVSAWGNRFLFTGREWLSEMGLYDYRNRLYQPELGRFMQPDPIQFEAGDYNLYRYCHNDPVNRSDPTGMVESESSPSDQKPVVQRDWMWEFANGFDSVNRSTGSFSMAQMSAVRGGRESGASNRQNGRSPNEAAVTMLSEMTQVNQDQTGAIMLAADGTPLRVDPVTGRKVPRSGSPSFGYSHEEERLRVPGGLRIFTIVHYHKRSGKEGAPSLDHDKRTLEKYGMIYFSNRDLARDGLYLILREGRRPEQRYDERMKPNETDE